ncbi:hypothetical protein MBRU_10925 [Mycolicibacterium brumae DSM 44177]|nr:hypothetical protein MBRU_10925 [Mycolicibacterium brumae DSM 44177]
MSATAPVAIIGIGCRLAGDVRTPAQFWDFITEGRSAVTEVPPERWEPYLRRDARNAAVLAETTRHGTFIDDLEGFDAEFFGVSPREAELMDPQQRLALEVSWEALEHAGVGPRSLAGSDTAVLMGVNSDDYGKLLMEDLTGIEAWTGIGTSLCGVANRVSHLLDLRGPSVALDAACAASLVAVHQACAMLRSGETSLALAGGVSALIGPGLTRVLDQAGATAGDGRCKTFDAGADGYGRGEGAAVVVLKRLDDALRAGDRVIAVVRGGAVASDGRTVGIMSPNGAAQADLFRLACRASDVDPATVDFIEAHGTGTPTGDPVEVAALAQVYGAARAPGAPAVIGSVKPNTGHLEGGAGAVGLIKAALALQHGEIPPTAGIRTLTTEVDWDTSGLRVNTVTEPWPDAGARHRRAAVCSYGYGGAIAHVLLEQAPVTADAPATPVGGPLLVPVSARTPARLADQAAALADHLDDHPLPEVAATLWRRRSAEPARAAVLAHDTAGLRAALRGLATGAPHPDIVRGEVLPGAADGAVWVFSGHGSQWPQMGAELLAGEPAFARVIDEIEPIYQSELGFSPRAALAAGDLGDTDRIQALTFAVQVGLAAVLRERGLSPAAVIGHSVGEVAACVTAGVFDLAQGAAVACYRARGFRRVQGAGAMAMVSAGFDEVRARLADRTDVVAAISSSPTATVISGERAAVADISEQWSGDGLAVRRVNTNVAFHSPAMSELTGELSRLVATLPPGRPAATPLYTTALADPRSTAQRGPQYWATNLAGRVRFAEAVTAAAEDGHRLFLEVSAHPVVAHSVSETLLHLGIEDYAVTGTLRRDGSSADCVARATATLHCHGAPVPAPVPPGARWAELPGAQWRHRRFWRTPTAPPGGRGLHDPGTHTLLGEQFDIAGPAPARVWETRLDMDTRPYPATHPVYGAEIVPAAVLLNTFLTAAGTDIADVRLRTPVPPGQPRDIQVVRQDGSLSLAGRPDGQTSWLTHCSASIRENGCPPEPLDIPSARNRCREEMAPEFVVDTLAGLGVAEMGFDWRIVEHRRGDGEHLVTVRADGARTWAPVLDAATSAASTVFDGRLRMPSRIERLTVLSPPAEDAMLHIRPRPGGTCADVLITDTAGEPLSVIAGMTFEELENSDGEVTRMLHRLSWHPMPLPDQRPPRVVLVGGDDRVAAWCARDLDAHGVDWRRIATAAALPDRLPEGSAVLVLPADAQTPTDAVGQLLNTLKAMRDKGVGARLWTLTHNVRDGADLNRSPLWGLARVAATEHPQLWGGVLDLDADELPVTALSGPAGHPVVSFRDGAAHTARLAAPGDADGQPLACSPAGSYLITGGTGALGLRVAEHLAELGARRLILASRSGLPPRREWAARDDDVIRAVLALEEHGVTVTGLALDIGARGAADRLRAALAELPEVRGVVHAAGVDASAVLTQTTEADLTATMSPKVDGALALHEVFPPGTLDWLVLFSSCGYLAGFPGQGAYACGNAFLDALARHRRARGDNAAAVAWTAWRGLGMGSDSAFVAAQLDAFGMGSIAPDQGVSALAEAMRSGLANPVVLPVLPAAASIPIFADVAAPARPDTEPAPAPGPHDGMDTAEWAARQVLDAVAGELGLAPEDVDVRAPLVEIGVDSIMTVALRRRLEQRTGLRLPPTLLWEHPTAAAVTARITELCSVGEQVPDDGVGEQPAPIGEDEVFAAADQQARVDSVVGAT